jgi:polyisoprenyl-teichoic acid--peptidoglycan teichoic acid transferase
MDQPAGPPEPRGGPPWFAVATFWAFVVGGLVFGAIFLTNWRALGTREQPARVIVAAGPVTVAVPVTINAPAPLVSRPVARPAEAAAPPLSSAIAGVVRNVVPEWSGKERINILLLGIDKRDDEPINGTRSDTMMIASIDPVARSAALVSLPRDMWVTIPGCTAAQGCSRGQQRINFAHAVGGPDMAKRTISNDFGIPIQYYARVDFRGFEELVDLVGGVLIDVDRPVKDDEYPTENYGFQRIYYAPGPQLLDGKHALQYARSRHGSNDFSRAKRQQTVLVSLRERALQLNMLSRAPTMLGIVQNSLSTDLSPVQLLSLARLVSEIDRDRIGSLVIDTNHATPFKGSDGADLLDPDLAGIRRAFESTVRTAAHPELKARIEVLNGSGTAGLGQKAADYLTAQGFNVVKIAVAERSDYRSSLVEVLTADRRAAEALATTLKVPTTAITDTPTPNAVADIRIVVGQDFRIPTS